MTPDGELLGADRLMRQWLPGTAGARAKRKIRCLECGRSELRSPDLTRAETFALTHARATGHREFEETAITPMRLRLPGDRPVGERAQDGGEA